MAYLLVPLGVSATEAMVWIAVVDENPDSAQIALESNLGQHALNLQWESWISQNGKHKINYQRVRLSGLQSRRAYSLRLRLSGEIRADAEFNTLPDHIPTIGEKPFTVLLGSCFCRREDEEGKVGNTYLHMPGGARPDVKILCGDQVYLDDPWHEYLEHTHSIEELQNNFFINYLSTWTQTNGFEQFLKSGANYFCPDDHELWNNAPNRATVIRDTWPIFDKRDDWHRKAIHLYQVFQSASNSATFSVGNLSFFIADTRLSRDSDRTNFMKDEELDKVGTWINGLTGPGALVVGQPIFRGKTSFLSGTFGDWTLSDFKQYGRLVQMLVSSKHSIVILTGDVHYGRVTKCTLSSGNKLVEVISSPLSLVDPRAAGKWEQSPDFFPAFDIPNVVKAPVQTLEKEKFSPSYSHFLTLEFSAASDFQVIMALRVWPILHGGLPGPDFGKEVDKIFL
jgi:phosphodiesterase/alkaline phosphatase D-like protein